jgi:hypothetical protein
MKHRNWGRLFGSLAVAALGAMALAASSQAVAPGFLINKKSVGALLATVSGEQIGTASMLVAGLNFQLRCTKSTVDEGHIASNTDAKGVVLFTGCTTLSITKFPEEIHCHVTEPIRVEALLLPAELTDGTPAVLLEKIKALIKLHLPEVQLGNVPCVLPLDNIVTGELCLAIKNNDTVEPLSATNGATLCRPRIVLEGAEGSGSIQDVVKYGAQAVVLDGEGRVFLTGVHAGLTLGVSLY